MTFYAVVDVFSQTINPVLALIVLGAPWISRQRLVERRTYYTGALAAVALAYLWWWGAKSSHQWEQAWGVQFSTHWAVHLALLSAFWPLRGRWRVAAIVIALGYGALILARGYHTPADLFWTSAALLPTLALLWWVIIRGFGPVSRARPPDSTPMRV